MQIRVFGELTYSVDRLTGDGSLGNSLCPPDVAITGHVPSSICSKPDIDLQLANPSLSGYSGTTSWTFPFWSVIRSVTCTGVDCQTNLVLVADTDPCRRRTWPNIEKPDYTYFCHGFCCSGFAAESASNIADTFGTKSNQRIPRIRRKHIWKASSFCSGKESFPGVM